MKHPAPRPGKESAPLWKAARDGVLQLPYCGACRAFRWPARRRCVSCDATLEWRESRGTGTVATYSIVRRAVDPTLKDDAPYIVAFVDLDDGVRMLANIVGVSPGAVRAGQRVRCRFEPTVDPDMYVPVFEITREGG